MKKRSNTSSGCKILPFLHPLIFSVFCAGLVSCASQRDVLSPVGAVSDLPAEERLNSPSYEKLAGQFKLLGYDGVGLQYETARVHDLLSQVFSDPKTHNREIQLVYTGVAMSYDARYKSLTVGGLTDPAAIVQFVVRQVPSRSLAIKPEK